LTTIDTSIPEADEATARAASLFDEARGFEVDNAEDYEAASRLRQDLKRALDVTESERVQLKEPSLAEGRRIDTAFKPAITRLKEATNTLDLKMRAWRAAEESRRREAERKAREAAELERLKLQKAAERAEKRGLTDTADELQRAAHHVPTPVIASHVPKVDGLSVVKVWKFVVEDEDAVPREFCAPDLARIRNRVNSLRGATAIPGVRVYEEESYRSGRE
jgi:hypothetical protein